MKPPPWGYLNLLNVKTQSAGDKNKKFTSHELTLLYKAYSQTYDNIAELLNCKFKQFVRNRLLELSEDIRTIVNDTYMYIVYIYIDRERERDTRNNTYY